MIECIENKLSLYLCVSHLVNVSGLRIDTIKVIASPGNQEEKCKVWRASDVELNANSNMDWHRRKKWKFDKKKMLEYFVDHSLVIELQGIHLI